MSLPLLETERISELRAGWQPGQTVEVTRGELCGRTGSVVIQAGKEVLVRLEPAFNWPMTNTIGIPAGSLRAVSGRR